MKTVALFHTDSHYINALIPQFQACLPQHRIVAWDATHSHADYLIAWKPTKAIFKQATYSIVFALGAGVDAFLDADIRPDSHIVRLEEAGMGAQMLEIALYGILHHTRDMMALHKAQRQGIWLAESTPKKCPFSSKIGVMGLGELGGYVARHLAHIGYPVSGYSLSKKHIEGVQNYDATERQAFLSQSEVLINLLPLTRASENILNAELFAQLPNNAYLINLARGKHLREDDLIPALNSGQLAGALLDVFQTEPLPAQHPFWCDERILITPHLAAITLQHEAVEQISNNIMRYERGQSMRGVVDRTRGY